MIKVDTTLNSIKGVEYVLYYHTVSSIWYCDVVRKVRAVKTNLGHDTEVKKEALRNGVEPLASRLTVSRSTN